MAIIFTQRANIGAAAVSVTTASITPTANSRLWAIGGARPAAAVPPVITDSLGGSWTVLPGSNIEFGNINGSISYRDIGASPSAMTVTATSTGADATGVMCFDMTGAGTDYSNFKSATNSAGDPSLTLATTPAAASYVIASMIGNTGAAPGPAPVGYTNIYSSAIALNLRMALYLDATSAAALQSWTSSSLDSISYGLEFKLPAAAGAMKVWSGSAWVLKPVKVWTGSAWVGKPLKRWNGSAWV